MASFKVITSSDIEEFEKNVNEYVDKRWLIINCSSVRSASSDNFIFHAFLKKTEFRRDSSFGGRSGDRNRGRDRDRSGDRNRDYRPRRNQGDRRDGKDRSRGSSDTAPRTARGEKNKFPKGFSSETRTRSKTTFDPSKTKKPRHEKRSDQKTD